MTPDYIVPTPEGFFGYVRHPTRGLILVRLTPNGWVEA